MDLSSLFSLIVAIKPLETWEKPKRHKIVSLWPTCKKAYSLYVTQKLACGAPTLFQKWN